MTESVINAWLERISDLSNEMFQMFPDNLVVQDARLDLCDAFWFLLIAREAK